MTISDQRFVTLAKASTPRRFPIPAMLVNMIWRRHLIFPFGQIVQYSAEFVALFHAIRKNVLLADSSEW